MGPVLTQSVSMALMFVKVIMFVWKTEIYFVYKTQFLQPNLLSLSIHELHDKEQQKEYIVIIT